MPTWLFYCAQLSWSLPNPANFAFSGIHAVASESEQTWTSVTSQMFWTFAAHKCGSKWNTTQPEWNIGVHHRWTALCLTPDSDMLNKWQPQTLYEELDKPTVMSPKGFLMPFFPLMLCSEAVRPRVSNIVPKATSEKIVVASWCTITSSYSL